MAAGSSAALVSTVGDDEDGNAAAAAARGGNQAQGVWTGTLIIHSLVLFLSWFTATLVYYGLGYSAGDMTGGLYANSIALSAVDVPGNLLYAVLADREYWGRRRTQVLLFGMAGATLLLGPLIHALSGHTLSPGLLKGLAIAGKLCAAGFFNGVYVYAAEIFPTPVRSTGLGACTFLRLINIETVFAKTLK